MMLERGYLYMATCFCQKAYVMIKSPSLHILHTHTQSHTGTQSHIDTQSHIHTYTLSVSLSLEMGNESLEGLSLLL